MTTRDPRQNNSTIDAEMLAGYIDNRLTPEQRAAVEAQLAADPDSYALLVETLKAQDALAIAPTTTVAPSAASRGSRAWIYAGAGLALAAAIVLAVRMQPSDPSTAAMKKLVAAAGEARYIDARVTGGFKFGPMRPVTRGPSDTTRTNLQLVAAAAELREAAHRDPSATNLTAWGVAQLLLRDYDGAVTTLTDAREKDSSAAVNANLSAVYLSRGITANSAADLASALQAADDAVAKDPRLTEALYNRALILEALARNADAAAAWQVYLNGEGNEAWSTDARARLNRLTTGR